MITLCIMFAFKGTKMQAAKALIACLIIDGFVVLSCMSCSPDKSANAPVEIVKQTTDERGLTSVVIRKNGKEWAYDYLTQEEYDSITTK